MKKIRASFWIAGFCLAYWAGFYLFVFQDLYLSFDRTGDLLKILAPLALIANFVGTVLALSSRSERKTLTGLAVLLNTLPIAGILWFLWWLFFGVKL